MRRTFNFDPRLAFEALAAMEVPTLDGDPELVWTVDIQHPGGVGEILQVADGGSWLKGVIQDPEIDTSEVQFVAIA